MTQEELDAFMNEENESLIHIHESQPKKAKMSEFIETIIEEVSLSEHYVEGLAAIIDENISFLTTLTRKFPTVESFQTQLAANCDAKKSVDLLTLALKEIALQL